MIDRIVASCPDQAIERFEEISYLIKNSDTLKLEEFVRCDVDRQYAKHSGDLVEFGTSATIEDIRKMFPVTAVSAAVANEEDPGEGGGAAIGLVQDLTSLNRHVFNQAGYELGDYGALILQKSLKQLSIEKDARSIRFWGRI